MQTTQPFHGPGPDIEEETAQPVDRQLTRLSALLSEFAEAAQADQSLQARREDAYQTRLAVTRLGLASALFVALRAKHAPTAAHALRVALTCSAWSQLLQLNSEERDALEVAALLHDIGKIGVPDRVLLKPGELTAEEMRVMQRHRQHARDILTTCCTSQEVLDAVYYSAAWFDGRTPGFDRQGTELPQAARILAIVDAYDAMTTNHIYRRALSRDAAVRELFEHAGTQFDPELVRSFSCCLGDHREQLRAEVLSHWLRDLRDREAPVCWQLCSPLPPALPSPAPDESRQFHEQVLEHLHASVVFVDRQLTIVKWSRECEVLTGLPAASVEHLRWDPGLIQLRDENYTLIPLDHCPVSHTLRSGRGCRLRLVVTNAQREKVAVDAQVIPVHGADGEICGAALLMFDASSQVNLERQVECLHERASQDGLTKIGNRAEFDRQHAALVRQHHEREGRYSLIICDLDHFKQINDTFGHPAGDEALISFATLLKKFCRTTDVVARYGGEEFVVLCADCGQDAAAARAETLREAWAAKPHPHLGGKCLTCSFGVTELQAGDTPETMLRRADRALLQAKDNGRNTVFQLGCGPTGGAAPRPRRAGWLSWFRREPTDKRWERKLLTASPLKITVQKLRGFVADQAAQILEMDENRLMLEIESVAAGRARGAGERPRPYVVELQFEEIQVPTGRRGADWDTRTLLDVTIRPKRDRDLRRGNLDDAARQLLVSIQAYLMAQEYVRPELTGGE